MRKKILVISGIILILFFFSRLYNLTALPIFTDEAIYLRWAQIAKNDASWRFISLTDGKQPLFIWLVMVVMKFITDPLLAGRLVSVMAGLASMVGIYFLGTEVFKDKKVGLFSASLYLISPFSVFYDRIALMDTLVGTFAIWSLFLAIVLVRTLRLDVALILGAALGGGILTKTSGFFNIYLLPLTLLCFLWKEKKRWAKFLRWLGLTILAVIISQLFYAILRLSPLSYTITQKDTTFVFTVREWLSHPFTFFWGNLSGLWGWLTTYLTWPLVLLILASLIFGFWQKSRKSNFLKEKLLLFLWFLLPFVALAAFGKVIYPRFVFFMSLPLLVLAAAFLVDLSRLIKRKLLFAALCILIFTQALYFDSQIIFNVINAPLPYNDRLQYLDDWPAGFGVKETVTFLQKEAADKKIFVGTEGTFGLFPASLELYLWDNKNIELKGYWPTSKAFGDLTSKAKSQTTYFITKESEEINQPAFNLLLAYPRGKGKTHLKVYQVVP